MSSSTSGHTHLQQTQLGTSTVALLNGFGDWLQTAQFEDVGGGSKRCVDRGVRRNVDALLVDLGIATMFGSKPWGYTIWRISGPSAARFKNSKGAAYLYPIRLYSDPEPTISGSPLRVGEVTCIEEEVLVSPLLDCLFVVVL